MVTKGPDSGYYLQTLSNALDVLESLADENKGRRLTDLATSLGMSRPSLYRALVTLEARGFVTRDPESQRYRLGPHLWRLGSAFLAQTGIKGVASPELSKLVERVRETALLAMLSEPPGSVLYLDKVDPSENRQIKFYSRVGGTAPLHATASGKTLLAYQPEEFISRILSTDLEQYTENTITCPAQLRVVLERVREQGWSQNLGEWRRGLGSLAAPVWNAQGAVQAAVVISVLADRLRSAEFSRLKESVVGCATSISQGLGYTTTLRRVRDIPR